MNRPTISATMRTCCIWFILLVCFRCEIIPLWYWIILQCQKIIVLFCIIYLHYPKRYAIIVSVITTFYFFISYLWEYKYTSQYLLQFTFFLYNHSELTFTSRLVKKDSSDTSTILNWIKSVLNSGEYGLVKYFLTKDNMNHLYFPTSAQKYDIQKALDELGYKDTFSFIL